MQELYRRIQGAGFRVKTGGTIMKKIKQKKSVTMLKGKFTKSLAQKVKNQIVETILNKLSN